VSGIHDQNRSNGRLRRVVVQVDIVGLSDHFAVSIVTTGRADVMRAFQFAAIPAFIWVIGHKRIMRTAIVPARAGHAILWDSHVSTSVIEAHGLD